MSKPDRLLIIPPDDPHEDLRDLGWMLLGIPPPLVFAGLVFMMPAVGVLYMMASQILAGQISISLSGSLLAIIAAIMAWGGVEMIREDSRRRG
ncbi:hypothetical protein [Bradyrhizobium prioriisuperbiae]|uniref:hypothetical protein n=1 Tax=Bradyrhizobium prioriisuperbiae TaxID=2854389 RepID=UPI0028E97888|nr:hypothetical protein [Bradyrhizobium prioritasuperba]